VTLSEVPNSNTSNQFGFHTVDPDNDSEFVNTNLLDHTELLSGKKMVVQTKHEESKVEDYDSDIEIIEDYTNQLSTDSLLEKVRGNLFIFLQYYLQFLLAL
jgi:hypothetical protein